MQQYCASCHATGTDDDDEKFMGWSDQQFIDHGLVVAGNPSQSALYQYLNGIGNQMPPNTSDDEDGMPNPMPSPADIQVIGDWITNMRLTN